MLITVYASTYINANMMAGLHNCNLLQRFLMLSFATGRHSFQILYHDC